MAPDPSGERSSAVEIVAEAANGHEGDRWRLLLLTRLAVAAGADAVKFQLVYSDEIFTRDHSLFVQFVEQELPDDAWQEAASLTQASGRRFYLDVFGPRSARLAQRVGADGVKLHATDIANHTLMRTVAEMPIPRVLLGSGGAFRAEIETALELLPGKDVVLLHGFQAYPTANPDNQILRLAQLRSEFPQAAVGFADHVPPEDPATAWLSALAIGAGATMIEKHLTSARVLRSVDYEAALNPDDFASFVRNMYTAADAAAVPDMSTQDYGMSAAERNYRDRVRKSLVAARDLRSGQVLTASDLALKRSPRAEATAWDPAQAAGRRLRSDVLEGDPIHAGLLVDGDG